jgi:hypothetical protein
MMELFRLGTRVARLGKEVPLDSIGLDVLGITFCVCLSKRTHKSHQSVLPRGDGTFPAIQLSLSLSLSGMELLLQVDGHR